MKNKFNVTDIIRLYRVITGELPEYYATDKEMLEFEILLFDALAEKHGSSHLIH